MIFTFGIFRMDLNMDVRNEIQELNTRLIPKMRKMVGELVEFQSKLSDEDFQDELEEVIIGFGKAVEATNGSFKEMLDSSTNDEELVPIFQIILGTMRESLFTHVDLFEEWQQDLNSFVLDELNIEELTRQLSEFSDKLEEFLASIDDLEDKHGLDLQLPNELLEHAWHEVKLEAFRNALQDTFELLDALMRYGGEWYDIDEFLDSRNQLVEIEKGIQESINEEELLKDVLDFLPLLFDIQIQSAAMMKERLMVDRINIDKEVLEQRMNQAAEFSEGISLIIGAVQDIFISPFDSTSEE